MVLNLMTKSVAVIIASLLRLAHGSAVSLLKPVIYLRLVDVGRKFSEFLPMSLVAQAGAFPESQQQNALSSYFVIVQVWRNS